MRKAQGILYSRMPRHSCCEVRIMQLHDILLLRTSAILPEAISAGGLTPTTDTSLLLTTYRGGSHLPADILHPDKTLAAGLGDVKSVFLKGSSFTIPCIKDPFADTKAFWCYLQKLIRINKFNCLLQTEYLRWSQL